jgi:DNA modification methylase
MKPVELIEHAILNSSKKINIIIDLFLGSGSTLIASEKTNRICYGMEISPHYCDVIVKRWENYTDKKAVLYDPN